MYQIKEKFIIFCWFLDEFKFIMCKKVNNPVTKLIDTCGELLLRAPVIPTHPKNLWFCLIFLPFFTFLNIIHPPEKTTMRMGIGENKHAEKDKISLHLILWPEQSLEAVNHEDSVLFHVLWEAWAHVVLHHCRHVVTVICIDT